MPRRGHTPAWSMVRARLWRAQYDADETLRVEDLAEQNGVSWSTMRTALIAAGGPLRRANRHQRERVLAARRQSAAW